MRCGGEVVTEEGVCDNTTQAQTPDKLCMYFVQVVLYNLYNRGCLITGIRRARVGQSSTERVREGKEEKFGPWETNEAKGTGAWKEWKATGAMAGHHAR